MMQNGNLLDRVGGGAGWPKAAGTAKEGKAISRQSIRRSRSFCGAGKSCFQVKKLEEGLNKNIGAALDAGTRHNKEKGWT